MTNLFDTLLTEISWMYDKGYPDFTLKEDREALYDYLLSIGFPHSDVIELSERFIAEADIPDDKMITYTDDDGSKEMAASSAKTMPKDHPARIAYDKLKGSDTKDDTDDDEQEEPSSQKLSGPEDFERPIDNKDDDGVKDEKAVVDSNLSEDQVKYYEEEASQNNDVKIDPNNMPKESKAIARNLFAKLQLTGMGKDVELTEADIHNLQYLVISGNSRSGQMYWQGRTDKAGGIQNVANRKNTQDIYGKRVQSKNELLQKWDSIKQELIEKGVSKDKMPKFKSGATVVDNPPDVSHTPTSFKPNKIYENAPQTNGIEMLGQEISNKIKEETGVDVGADDFFGEPLDPDNPETFVKEIKRAVDLLDEYAKENAPDKTKKYINDYVNDMKSIIDDENLSTEEKMEKLRSSLSSEFMNMYTQASQIHEDEGKNVLKDMGEIFTYMNYLAEGKECYMPVSGNYPLADVIIVNRDENTGDVVSIDGISIKSQRGKEQQPGSSASEFCKHFIKVYPEHKEKFENIENMHRGSIEQVDNITDPKLQTQIENIKSIEDAEDLDKAKDTFMEVFGDYDDADEKWNKIMKKLNRYHSKYGATYGLENNVQSLGPVLKEMTFREFSGSETLRQMSDLNLDTKLKFVELVNTGGPEININQKDGNFTTSDFGLHDKGYMEPPRDNIEKDPPPPRVTKQRYTSANWALRIKKKK